MRFFRTSAAAASAGPALSTGVERAGSSGAVIRKKADARSAELMLGTANTVCAPLAPVGIVTCFLKFGPLVEPSTTPVGESQRIFTGTVAKLVPVTVVLVPDGPEAGASATAGSVTWKLA